MNMIDKYWAEFFGIEPELLKTSGVQVVPHRILQGYDGAWLFQHQSLVIISVPDRDVTWTQEMVTTSGVNVYPISIGVAEKIFGSKSMKMIGPAYQGYLTAAHFRPFQLPDVMPVQSTERAALRTFSWKLDAQDWDDSAIEFDDENIFAVRDGENIVAAANAKLEDGAMFIGVVVSPEFRGQGFGKAVVSAAVSNALHKFPIIRYQTLESNLGSTGIATALGFQYYARTIAVRFIR